MREKVIELNKSFMWEHGERKKKMKVSWNEYVKRLNQKEREE